MSSNSRRDRTNEDLQHNILEITETSTSVVQSYQINVFVWRCDTSYVNLTRYTYGREF